VEDSVKENKSNSKSKKIGLLRIGALKKVANNDEDSTSGKKSNKKIKNEYVYPLEKRYKGLNRTQELFGPYGTQWVHEKQVDDKITKQVKRNRKIYDFLDSIDYAEQRSDRWFKERRGKITASDGGCVIGMNHYEPQWCFVLKKVSELPFQSNIFCYHGKKLEEPATMVYEYRMNVKVTEFGMVPHKKISFLGASPDGIVSPYKLDGEHLTEYVGRMLEIKCPLARKIKKVGDVKGVQCPIYYWVQVQLQLECCDLEECDFWQCEIWEYEDRDDFIEDSDPDYPWLSIATKMEKGAVIQILPYKLPDDVDQNMSYLDRVYGYAKFIYPKKIEMTPHDVDMWIVKTITELKETDPGYYFDKVCYWKMADTHNVTIKRDREWFEEYLPVYRKIWSYVEYFREHEDKWDLVSDYIDSLRINMDNPKQKEKYNDKLMNIIETIYNEPEDGAKKSKHKEYGKFVASVIKETIENNKENDMKDLAREMKEEKERKEKEAKRTDKKKSKKKSKKSSK
jgi:putative phage-type endonuclease